MTPASVTVVAIGCICPESPPQESFGWLLGPAGVLLLLITTALSVGYAYYAMTRPGMDENRSDITDSDTRERSEQ
ncbi:hypothetical protein OHB26_38820 (plasmid) [Nocardia sp. NBC_01503]|uniref:hypothetical protein n=1 Tax=Nocardia sp. NBC_01503 TaxID=2975997 RepID=UPI002E7BBC99|nr:hypothetical protein [Nocardia sp. NBC_01503]WTL36632.1 hypothetical protein OHB26_38820 [Nocardia sp. NBC_01503]